MIEEAGRSACQCPFVVSPCRSLTLERRPLPKNRLLLHVSRPRPPRLRLPRHLGGYHLLGAHTGLYFSHNIRTITTLRLRGDFNPSTPTFDLYSSLIVCGARVATAGGGGVLDCVCVSVCGPAPLLGYWPIRVRVESIYCTLSLYAIHPTVHSSTFSSHKLHPHHPGSPAARVACSSQS
jgi:hypothetical protein